MKRAWCDMSSWCGVVGAICARLVNFDAARCGEVWSPARFARDCELVSNRSRPKGRGRTDGTDSGIAAYSDRRPDLGAVNSLPGGSASTARFERGLRVETLVAAQAGHDSRVLVLGGEVMLDGHFVRCRADNRTGGFSPDLSSERGRADGWGTNEGQRVFLRVDLFLRWTAPEATSVARQVLVVVEEVERIRVYPVGQEVTVQIELMHAPLAPRGVNVHRFPRAPQLRTEPVSAVPAGGRTYDPKWCRFWCRRPRAWSIPRRRRRWYTSQRRR